MSNVLKMADYRKKHMVIPKGVAVEINKQIDLYEELEQELWQDMYIEYLQVTGNVEDAMTLADDTIAEMVRSHD
jgi:ribosomal protein L6P/L9E